MARALREIFNEANPNKLASAAEALPLGEALALVKRFTRGTVTAGILTLPTNAKAACVLRAYAVAGSVTGLKTPIPGAAPATTQVGVTAIGDVIFNVATDAVTEAEVAYEAFEGPVISDLVQVASSSGVLNQSRKAQAILSATVVTGVVAGALIVDARGSTATPATGHCCLQDDGKTVKFNAAQVVTGTVTVVYAAQPGVGTTPAAVGVTLDAVTQNF